MTPAGLRKWAELHGLTWTRISRVTGLSQSLLFMAEQRGSVLSARVLSKIANHYDTTPVAMHAEVGLIPHLAKVDLAHRIVALRANAWDLRQAAARLERIANEIEQLSGGPVGAAGSNAKGTPVCATVSRPAGSDSTTPIPQPCKRQPAHD